MLGYLNGFLMIFSRDDRTFLQAMELVMTGSDALDLSSGGMSSTFFVPTDTAFEELGAAAIEEALKNRSLLKTVSSNHFFFFFFSFRFGAQETLRKP